MYRCSFPLERPAELQVESLVERIISARFLLIVTRLHDCKQHPAGMLNPLLHPTRLFRIRAGRKADTGAGVAARGTDEAVGDPVIENLGGDFHRSGQIF